MRRDPLPAVPSSSIEAPAADLAPAVAAALADPAAPERIAVAAGGTPFRALAWGDPGDPPLLLVHGVTASSGTWWRVGPALAAAGFRVVAPDLPGHGLTGAWRGRHRFAETAVDLAGFVREAGMAGPSLAAVGHSWGAMVVAGLPGAGIVPRVVVLVDPPVQPVEAMAAMTTDPLERRYDDRDEAVAAIRAAYPAWSDGDVLAKADGLTRCDVEAVREVLHDNGDWDGGLGALASARSAGVWVVRGEPRLGGLVPDGAVPAFHRVIGADRVATIRGAPHSPHRTHVEATLVAVLRALTA